MDARHGIFGPRVGHNGIMRTGGEPPASRGDACRGSAEIIIGTIGHSTHPLSALIDRLRSFGATHLVDVRRVPRSGHNPQFNAEALPGPLAAAGIAYRHEPAKGADDADSHRAFLSKRIANGDRQFTNLYI